MTVTLPAKTYTPMPGREAPEVEPLSFASYGAMLRHIAAHGFHGGGGPRPTPRSWHLGLRDHRTGKPSGFSVHEAGRWLRHHAPGEAELDALMRLQDRYRAYCHHVTEVAPQWRETDRIPYMDNSVEVVETNRWGGTRRRQVVAPHGDACY